MPAHRDPLHDLILSLTPSEKRYFKLQNKTEGTKTYIKLFDVLEAQERYDELLLRRSLEGEKLLNQLHVAKNYLYKQILRSLRSFHAGSDASPSPFLAFAEQLGDMTILHSKGLFEQSKKALRKAESIAEEYDDDLFRLMIAANSNERVSELVDAKAASKARYRKRADLLDRLRSGYSLKLSLEELYDEIALKGRREFEADALSAIKFDELNFASKIDYCSYRCYDHFSREEYSSAAQWSKQAIDLFELHPHQRERSTEIYLSLLSNYFTCLLNERYASDPAMLSSEAFDRALAAFDSVNARTVLQKTRVWATRRLAEFEWALATGNDDRLRRLLPQFLKEFSTRQRMLSKLEQGWFFFNVSKSYFWIGQLDNALTWINRLLDDVEFKKYEEYYGQAMMYALIIHAELGKQSYLKTAIPATRRFLNSRSLLTDFESQVLDGLAQGRRLQVLGREAPGYFEFERWSSQEKEAATL